MIGLNIEELPEMIKDEVDAFLRTHPRSPAARLRPLVGMAGDYWLVFIGPELVDGTTGVGTTPCGALEDFNRNHLEPVASRNGSDRH